jgi:hypothetical protein
MKLILSCLSIIISIGVHGQSVPGITLSNYDQLSRQETEFMTRKLLLSSVQADSVSAVNRNYYFKVAGLQNKSLSLTERGQQLQQIENERKVGLTANLTANQYSHYFDVIEEGKRRIQHRMDSLKIAHQRH